MKNDGINVSILFNGDTCAFDVHAPEGGPRIESPDVYDGWFSFVNREKKFKNDPHDMELLEEVQ